MRDESLKQGRNTKRMEHTKGEGPPGGGQTGETLPSDSRQATREAGGGRLETGDREDMSLAAALAAAPQHLQHHHQHRLPSSMARVGAATAEHRPLARPVMSTPDRITCMPWHFWPQPTGRLVLVRLPSPPTSASPLCRVRPLLSRIDGPRTLRRVLGCPLSCEGGKNTRFRPNRSANCGFFYSRPPRSSRMGGR